MARQGNGYEIEFSPARMSPSYVRTRHKNIRCFPQCAGVHNERSFCGDSLIVSVQGDHAEENLRMIGEFHPVDVPCSLIVGDQVSEGRLEHYIEAILVLNRPQLGARFSFNPPRKWEYKAKSKPGDLHTFTIYCLSDYMVVATKSTDNFQLIPIWKNPKGGADGEEDEAAELPGASGSGGPGVSDAKPSRTTTVREGESSHRASMSPLVNRNRGLQQQQQLPPPSFVPPMSTIPRPSTSPSPAHSFHINHPLGHHPQAGAAGPSALQFQEPRQQPLPSSTAIFQPAQGFHVPQTGQATAAQPTFVGLTAAYPTPAMGGTFPTMAMSSLGSIATFAPAGFQFQNPSTSAGSGTFMLASAMQPQYIAVQPGHNAYMTGPGGSFIPVFQPSQAPLYASTYPLQSTVQSHQFQQQLPSESLAQATMHLAGGAGSGIQVAPTSRPNVHPQQLITPGHGDPQAKKSRAASASTSSSPASGNSRSPQ